MHDVQYNWVGKNTLQFTNGYALYCSGLFLYAVSYIANNRFFGYFDTTSSHAKIKLLFPAELSWNSRETLSKKDQDDIFRVINTGFAIHGLEPEIIKLGETGSSEHVTTLQLTDSMPQTPGGQRLDQNYSSEELTDNDRRTLWATALQQFMKANTPRTHQL